MPLTKVKQMVDVERIERRLAETVADLGLMDADGVLAADIDRRLAEAAGGDDAYRAGLARYAIDLRIILDGADTWESSPANNETCPAGPDRVLSCGI